MGKYKYIKRISALAAVQLGEDKREIYSLIQRCAAVDVAEVIRCKDCVHSTVFPNGCNISCDKHYVMTSAFGFCSEGERRLDD